MLAEPIEAAVLGNALVQARAMGAAPRDLEGMRALLTTTQKVVRYDSAGGESQWAAAEARVWPT